jgi:C_GCAxxG_C_C family probable redox protein
MLAVGEHLLGQVEDQLLKVSCGFAGGIGCTYQDVCGALSSGTMLIGALYGRTEPNIDDKLCQKLAAEYRERFNRSLGSVYCHQLRANGYGSEGREPCSVLVERAAHVLLNLLDQVDEIKSESA